MFSLPVSPLCICAFLYRLLVVQQKTMWTQTLLVAEDCPSPPSNREQSLQLSQAGSRPGIPRCGRRIHWTESVPVSEHKPPSPRPPGLALSTNLTPHLCILTPIHKCQNQRYRCHQVEWLPASMPWSRCGASDKQKCIIKWLPVATLSLIDRCGLLICCIQQLIAFVSLSKPLIRRGNRKAILDSWRDPLFLSFTAVHLCSEDTSMLPFLSVFCLLFS